MSKKLEALEKIINNVVLDENNDYREIEKSYNLIKQALKRLEAIDNAKPSKALKCLKEIHFFVNGSRIDGEKYEQKLQEINTIKQVIIKAQEQEKVLEIINGKNVDIRRFKFIWNSILTKEEKLKEYNSAQREQDKISQEEFELLKRWKEC